LLDLGLTLFVLNLFFFLINIFLSPFPSLAYAKLDTEFFYAVQTGVRAAPRWSRLSRMEDIFHLHGLLTCTMGFLHVVETVVKLKVWNMSSAYGSCVCCWRQCS